MQNIIIEKPYEFVPPHRGNWWPSFIQRFRLIDIYLRRHGITSYEVRHADRLRRSLEQGHGILLTPNHPRPEDPIVMGWLAREVRSHVFAMASWHLYHQDRFTGFAIRKMGGFSVYREGIDRQAIDTAIEILTNATRPLIIFPEGSVSRTNDRLNALLDGVAFMARVAAKRRAKQVSDGRVVVHPVGIKYLYRGDLKATLQGVLSEIEHRLSWRNHSSRPLHDRISAIGFALLALKELEYFGRPQPGSLSDRLSGLINRLLHPIEAEWIGKAQFGPVVPRIKALRMKIVPEMTRGEVKGPERERRWRQLADLYLSQQVDSYPPDYLTENPTVERLLETVERYEEDLTDQVRPHPDLRAVIEVGEPLEVGLERDRKSEIDPLMTEIENSMQKMLNKLAREATPWTPESGC